MKIKPAILREALLSRSIPTIVFDYETLEGNFKKFRRMTTETNATWSMAVKALSRSEILDVAKTYIDGFDISNINEWEKIKPSVEGHHKIWLTNGNLKKELEFFLKELPVERLLITINDLHDYDFIKSKNVPYLVRLATSEFLKQPGKSRFGISLGELDIIKDAISRDKNFKGFHLHQGLEDHNYQILNSMLKSMKEKLSAYAGKNYLLNLGGSFQSFEETEMTASLNFLKDIFKMHIEPGRALLKDAGYALTPIEKYFLEGETLRIFTRLSFINHLKWSKPYFAGILNQSEQIETLNPKSLVLEGPTCYEFDKSENIPIETPLSFTQGSLIVLGNITGYSAEWNSSFNGVPACEVKFVGRRRPDSPL